MAGGAIKVEGLNELRRGLSGFEKELFPDALAKTLTQLAWDAKDDTVKDMQATFDRPTPFTLNSLYVTQATKTSLQSKVWFKNPARLIEKEHYLAPQVRGGKRRYKPFEAALMHVGVLKPGYYAIPTASADLDAYGNWSRGQIVTILSYFQAFQADGFKANMTQDSQAKRWEGTKSKFGERYFFIPAGRKSGKLYPGIYRVTNNYGMFSDAIQMIAAFVRKADTQYFSVLLIDRIAQNVYDHKFDRLFTYYLDKAFYTAFEK